MNIIPKNNDDVEFVGIATTILNNMLSVYQPEEVYLIQVDRRFDYKWAGFSNKFLGAIGSWYMERLRVPPFVPEKIIEELHFRRSNDEYLIEAAKPLHIYQPSEKNFDRKIRDISDSAIFVWYSGETKINSQASVMFYSTCDDKDIQWFCSFVNKGIWSIRGTRNISVNEIRMYMAEPVAA